MQHRVIHLHALAPAKPTEGEPCNGCGACCALEPCPLGMVASLRVRGACRWLRWADVDRRYRCGLLQAAGPLRALAARWIGAGQGCDAALELPG